MLLSIYNDKSDWPYLRFKELKFLRKFVFGISYDLIFIYFLLHKRFLAIGAKLISFRAASIVLSQYEQSCWPFSTIGILFDSS